MPEPDDYGLTAVQTLARVGDPTRVPNFNGFWHAWHGLVEGVDPRLTPAPHREPDPRDDTGTHVFESVRHVRIGCAFVPAREKARAGLVVLHGYAKPVSLADDAERWSTLAERGVSVLVLRLRGYPGSRRDTGDLTDPDEGGWITRGLDAPGAGAEAALGWAAAQGVADIVNGLRALRAELGDRVPLYLHGESLGGGLGLIAAAQCPVEARPERLVVGLPTMGDWRWRLGRRCGGTGAEIGDMLVRHAEREGVLAERLGLLDTLTHAPLVHVPALVKLACRDDVVPAPTQSAVFNALGVDPGLKWRFVVPYGHHDGGLANARRHALFERCAHDFLDPARTPGETMAFWEPLLGSGERAPERPWASGEQKQGALFGGDEPAIDVARLIGAYETGGRTLDDLPYTAEFDSLYERVSAGGPPMTPRDVFHRLHNLRKAGKLARLGRAESVAVKLEASEEALLVSLVERFAGSLGQRDRLVYTPEFDLMIEKLNTETGRGLDPHTVWRLVAKLAK